MTFVWRHSLPELAASGQPEPTRHDWVDAAKGLGILLMFYGHFLQKGAVTTNGAINDQLRIIYSFHMPLFFVLSGFFFRPPIDTGRRVRQLAARRLIPVAFFGLLLAPMWTWYEVKQKLPLWRDTALVGADYLRGYPALDWVTWFLVCLFVAEVLAVVSLRYVRNPFARLALGLFSIWGGVIFSAHSAAATDGIRYLIGRTWFLSESVVALGFYAIGAATYPALRRLTGRPALAVAIFVVATAAVLSTYRLNHPNAVAVMMAARQHGDAFAFAFTALAGTAAIIALGTLVAPLRWLCRIGRNALPLLGLNGVFFHYVDPKLAHWLRLPDSSVMVTIEATLVTALSLLACAPVVQLLNRHVPQFIGRSYERGPWFPALEGPQPNAPSARGADLSGSRTAS